MLCADVRNKRSETGDTRTSKNVKLIKKKISRVEAVFLEAKKKQRIEELGLQQRYKGKELGVEYV